MWLLGWTSYLSFRDYCRFRDNFQYHFWWFYLPSKMGSMKLTNKNHPPKIAPTRMSNFGMGFLTRVVQYSCLPLNFAWEVVYPFPILHLEFCCNTTTLKVCLKNWCPKISVGLSTKMKHILYWYFLGRIFPQFLWYLQLLIIGQDWLFCLNRGQSIYPPLMHLSRK